MMKEETKWQRYIPWFLTIASSMVLLAIGLFLITNVNWFKDGVFEHEAAKNLEYRVYAYQMHLSMIKRSVGLFSGFAIMFLGTGVAFYTLKKQSSVSLGGAGVTASVISASPGIIAMVLGAFLIAHTISSKDDFPNFQESKKQVEIKGPKSGPGRVK
ncbi:MAG: hypothetical protein HEP71_15195 [Roseivirga sp.]|nr:hypothetical protein [Roseivirga sp.]